MVRRERVASDLKRRRLNAAVEKEKTAGKYDANLKTPN